MNSYPRKIGSRQHDRMSDHEKQNGLKPSVLSDIHDSFAKWNPFRRVEQHYTPVKGIFATMLKEAPVTLISSTDAVIPFVFLSLSGFFAFVCFFARKYVCSAVQASPLCLLLSIGGTVASCMNGKSKKMLRATIRCARAKTLEEGHLQWSVLQPKREYPSR